MKLSLKQKALAETLFMIATAIMCGVGVVFIITYISAQALTNILGVAALVYFAYLFYSITLSRLEHQETLKQMTEKKG